jgi:hypothetical protein
LLFSPDSSCLALQLLLCLFSCYPMQFGFECCLLSHENSSQIHDLDSFGRSACHPTPLSTFVPLPTSAWCYWLLWEVGLSAHSSSQPLLLYPCSFTETLVLTVWLIAPPWGRFSVPPPTSAVSLRLQFAVYIFQFCCEWIQSALGLQ